MVQLDLLRERQKNTFVSEGTVKEVSIDMEFQTFLILMQFSFEIN
jgi:hypothetical protein